MSAKQQVDQPPTGLPLLPRWLRVLSALVTAGVIVYFSIQPPPGTASGSQASGVLGQLLSSVQVYVAQSAALSVLTEVPTATWYHLFSYMGLSALIGYATYDAARSDWQAMLGIFVMTVAIGIAVELLQLQLPTRTFSTADMAVNAVGAAIGTTVFYTVEWLGRWLRR